MKRRYAILDGWIALCASLVVSMVACTDAQGWGLGEQRYHLHAAEVPAVGGKVVAWVDVPVGVLRRDVALSAWELVIGQGAGVRRQRADEFGSPAIAVALGRAEIGVGASIDALYLLGSQAATLDTGAQIASYLRAVVPPVRAPDSGVGWGVIQADTAGFQRFVWPVLVVEREGTPIRVEGSLQLGSGEHGRVHVPGGARLRLEAGSHSFGELIVDAGGRVELANGSKPVIVWIAGRFAVHGGFECDAFTGTVIVGYMGADAVDVSWPLAGTLIAPRTKVVVRRLQEEHRGAIFARKIVMEPQARLHHLPYEVRPTRMVLGAEAGEEESRRCEQCSAYGEREFRSCVSNATRGAAEKSKDHAACPAHETDDHQRCASLMGRASEHACLVAAAQVFDVCQADAGLRIGACARMGGPLPGALISHD